jgi:ATP adenylyltransferase
LDLNLREDFMPVINKQQASEHKKFVDLDNARVEEQKKVMEDIADANHCPFCLENLQKYHKKPILKEGEYWLLTENQWPYENTTIHLLAIYKQHVTDLASLDPEAGKELLEMMQWAETEFKIPGGGFVVRFGDTDYSAGTVNHLHAQLLQPDIHAPTYLDKPVKIKIGKTK